MKTIQEAFEENYLAYQEPANTKRGFRIRYAYIGQWYVFDPHSQKRGQHKALIGALCVSSTMLFILAAVWNTGLNANAFTGLFTGLSMAAYLFQWYGTILFTAAGERITQDEFGRIDHLLKISPLVNALLQIGASASGTLYMVRYGKSTDLLVILMYLLAGAACFLLFWEYQQIRYEKQENNALKDSTREYIRA